MTEYRKVHIPVALRWEVWERDDFTCHYCGSRRFLSVDHIVPESVGGELTFSNLVTSCRRCNSSKHVQDYSDFQQRRFEDERRIRALWSPDHYERATARIEGHMKDSEWLAFQLVDECQERFGFAPSLGLIVARSAAD